MRIVTGNKLNRLWRNGVVAKMLGKSSVLKTMDEVEANTNEENVMGAVVGKQLINNLSGVSFHPETDGLYAEYMVGADAVRKKLGSLELDTSNVLASGASINYTTTKSYSLLILVSASGSITGSNQIPGEHSLTAPGFTNIAKTQATGISAAIGERVMLFVSVRANVPNGTVITASVNGARNALALIGM